MIKSPLGLILEELFVEQETKNKKTNIQVYIGSLLHSLGCTTLHNPLVKNMIGHGSKWNFDPRVILTVLKLQIKNMIGHGKYDRGTYFDPGWYWRFWSFQIKNMIGHGSKELTTRRLLHGKSNSKPGSRHSSGHNETPPGNHEASGIDPGPPWVITRRVASILVTTGYQASVETKQVKLGLLGLRVCPKKYGFKVVCVQFLVRKKNGFVYCLCTISS